MFTLEKDFRFEAAHELPQHDGKCKRLHGHSWKGKVILSSHPPGKPVADLQEDGPKAGMLRDFDEVREALEPLIENYLDHHYLNRTTGLENPTSEELARWIYYRLKPRLGLLVAVVIEETCTCRVEYRPS